MWLLMLIDINAVIKYTKHVPCIVQLFYDPYGNIFQLDLIFHDMPRRLMIIVAKDWLPRLLLCPTKQ